MTLPSELWTSGPRPEPPMDPLGDPDLLAAAERAGFAVGPPPSDDPWADSPGSLQPDRVEDLAAPVLQVPDLGTAAAAAARTADAPVTSASSVALHPAELAAWDAAFEVAVVRSEGDPRGAGALADPDVEDRADASVADASDHRPPADQGPATSPDPIQRARALASAWIPPPTGTTGVAAASVFGPRADVSPAPARQPSGVWGEPAADAGWSSETVVEGGGEDPGDATLEAPAPSDAPSHAPESAIPAALLGALDWAPDEPPSADAEPSSNVESVDHVEPEEASTPAAPVGTDGGPGPDRGALSVLLGGDVDPGAADPTAPAPDAATDGDVLPAADAPRADGRPSDAAIGFDAFGWGSWYDGMPSGRGAGGSTGSLPAEGLADPGRPAGLEDEGLSPAAEAGSDESTPHDDLASHGGIASDLGAGADDGPDQTADTSWVPAPASVGVPDTAAALPSSPEEGAPRDPVLPDPSAGRTDSQPGTPRDAGPMSRHSSATFGVREMSVLGGGDGSVNRGLADPTPEGQLRAQLRQRAAATAPSGTAASSDLWLLVGQPQHPATGSTEPSRARSLFLTGAVIVVIVFLVIGFLAFFTSAL